MPKVDSQHEQQRRQQIIEAATKCFRRSGYDATSIDGVCHEAGLSKGGLYTYFKSKEQLFAAVCSEHWSGGFQQVMEGVDAAPTIDAKLDALGDAAFRRLGNDSAAMLELARMSLAVWNEAARNDDTRAITLAGYQTWSRQLEELLLEGQRRGEINPELDVPMVAIALIAAFDGLQVYLAVTGQPLDVELFRETFMRVICRGILA